MFRSRISIANASRIRAESSLELLADAGSRLGHGVRHLADGVRLAAVIARLGPRLERIGDAAASVPALVAHARVARHIVLALDLGRVLPGRLS